MHARVFRRITNRFSTISKTALLALFLFANVFGVVNITLAQSEEDIRLRYTKYLNLTNFTGSELSSAGLTQDATTQGIIGLKFNVAFSLNTSDGKTLEQAWSYITPANSSMNSSEGFLIRLCNTTTPTQCWVNTIPYRGNAENRGIEENAVISRIVNSNYSPGPNITNFSAFNKNDPNNSLAGGNGQRFRYSRDTGSGKNEGVISDFGNGIVFGPGSSVEATLWYCAENSGADSGSSAYTDSGNKGLNDTIATFDTLCNGGTYFRIGNPVSISIPTATADINALVNNSASTSKTVSNEDTNLPVCDISFFGNSKIVGCLSRLVYYGLYWPSAWVAGLFGSLFDFFIGYSVSDKSYRYEFAVNGWRLVRDIANVMFIIIMVYVGFAAVFSFGGKGGSTMKKVVPILIFNALIINFSLFATRTVIDLSNITARVFYSRMVVCDGKCVDKDNNGTPENIKRGLGGHWPLSEKIVSAFDPQRMFSASILNPKETQTGAGNPGDPLTPTNSSNTGKKVEQGKGFAQDSNEYAGYYALVSLIAAGIMLGIAAMFFNVTFMFVGRVIGLYMAMIFSPFAFLTFGGMPLFNIKGYTWDAWVKDLFNYAALAPVFTFFLYIVYSFLNTDIVKQIGVEDKTGGFFGTVLSIVIPMLFIYFLIGKGVSTAKRYSGEFGDMVQNKISGVVGGVGGVLGGGIGLAAGAGAFLGRNTIGRGMKAFGNAKTGRQVEVDGKMIDETRAMRFASNSANSWSARQANKVLNASQKGTFDFRNTKLSDRLNTGVSTLSAGSVKMNDKLTSNIGMGKDAGKGGILAIDKKRAEDRQKKNDERINFDHLSEDEAKLAWVSYKKQQAEQAGESGWQDNLGTTDIAKNSSEYKALLQKEKDLETRLANAKSTGNAPATVVAIETAIQNNKNEQQQFLETETKKVEGLKTNNTAEFQNLRTATVESLKQGDAYKESASYKTLADKRKGELDAYGTVKDGKKLTTVMRAEYAEGLLKHSFWMEDGKPRFAPGTLRAIGSIPGMTTALTLVGSTFASALVAATGTALGAGALAGAGTGFLDMVGGIHARAAKNSINAAKKGSGSKGSEDGKLQAKLADIEDKILAAANDHLKFTETIKSVDKLSNEQIDLALASAIASKQFQLKKLKDITTFDSEAEEIENEVKKAILEGQIAEHKKIKDTRDSLQSKINDLNRKTKEAEEKSKGKDTGKDSEKKDGDKDNGGSNKK
ncbi:MAG: hypothetical protein ACOYMZ_01255 [Minisyncoccia bacterium]